LTEEHYDLVVLGGGPAGASCALSLRDSGLRIAIIEKQKVPGDKVCGDAIPGEAIKILKSVIPDFDREFGKVIQKLRTRGSVFHYNDRALRQHWENEAYTCRRLYFDDFLLTLASKLPLTKVYQGKEIGEIVRIPGGFRLLPKDGSQGISCKMLVGADGINGLSSRVLGENKISRRHHVSAARAYFTGVSGVSEDLTEFYAGRQYGSGYFWIFPIYGKLVNAGFGMLTENILSANINFEDAFYDIIRKKGLISEKFRKAEQCSTLEYAGIPLGSLCPVRSGERFVLTGDSASLADPLSGAGIGNAVISGNVAARQVLRCLSSGDFSSSAMKSYDHEIHSKPGKELRRNTLISRAFSRFPILPGLVFRFGKKAAENDSEQ